MQAGLPRPSAPITIDGIVLGLETLILMAYYTIYVVIYVVVLLFLLFIESTIFK